MFLEVLPLCKLPIVPSVTLWPGLNILRILVFGLPGFIRPGKNKSFTCNYFLSGIPHAGVSGLRAALEAD